jgi:hypothetical protein
MSPFFCASGGVIAVRSYLVVTGCVFALLVVAHIVRVFLEGPGVLRQPDFLIATLCAMGLLGWACYLLMNRKPRRE